MLVKGWLTACFSAINWRSNVRHQSHMGLKTGNMTNIKIRDASVWGRPLGCTSIYSSCKLMWKPDWQGFDPVYQESNADMHRQQVNHSWKNKFIPCSLMIYSKERRNSTKSAGFLSAFSVALSPFSQVPAKALGLSTSHLTWDAKISCGSVQFSAEETSESPAFGMWFCALGGANVRKGKCIYVYKI
jgi:hypothetical protein